jgi:spore coat polysaccharide biosynthesis protein SpsF (cytidylyltransferase family)
MDKNIKTAALIYSRSDSTRLPRKAFLPFGNTNLILHVIERAINLNVDEIILATTDRLCDDEYQSIFDNNKFKNIKIFRGSCNNVVHRTIQALKENKIDRFCRINGDCPFFPYNHINDYMHNTKFCFINNIRQRTFPYGISIEILDTEYYVNNSHNVDKIYQEHVTQHLYIKEQSNVEKCLLLEEINKNYNENIDRYVIDTIEDYNFWKNKIANDSLNPNKIFL